MPAHPFVRPDERVAATALAMLLTITACTTAPVRVDGDAAGVAGAERAFASAARTSGVRNAFLGVLAADATLFRPGPVDGRSFMRTQPEASYRLEWEPRRVAVDRAGDLGLSTGPYRLTPQAKPGQPLFGQFLTVWKRGPLDRWEVLIDLGIAEPAPTAAGPLEVIAPDHGPAPLRTIAAAEAAFARRSSAEGLVAAYRADGSTRLRLLRDGFAPVADLAELPDASSRWTWTMTDHGVARDGDLAWVMGRYRSATSATGYYVRVWRAERGDWKILADVVAAGDEAAP